MNTYMVGYDLNRPRGADDYPKLISAIKGYPTWWHHLDSTWMIKTDQPATAIRDHLAQFVDSGDELLVARLAGESAWRGFSEQASTWLRNNM
jgi:hypothetical protein